MENFYYWFWKDICTWSVQQLRLLMLFNVCKLTGRYNLFTVTKESVHIKKVVELIERRKRIRINRRNRKRPIIWTWRYRFVSLTVVQRYLSSAKASICFALDLFRIFAL